MELTKWFVLLLVFAQVCVMSVSQYFDLFLICQIICAIPQTVASIAIIRNMLLLVLKIEVTVSNAADVASRIIPSVGLSSIFFILIFLFIVK